MASFVEVSPSEMGGDVFSRIGKQWMLVGAGSEESGANMMTASWGAMGVLWNKPVTTVYIRPSRYTMEFIERETHYALCFFEEGYREALALCGRRSGRDIDKAKETGLTPCFDYEAPCFEQAELVVICRKLYAQDMDPSLFLDSAIENNYHGEDYHRIYTGEIVRVLKRP